MKIVVAGGSGFLGQILGDRFVEYGHEVIILSRSENASNSSFRYVKWDGENSGDWVNELQGTDVVINLSGKSVDCRYSETNKKLIYDSRLKSTKIIGEEISKMEKPPKLWMNAASATIYKYSYDIPRDEDVFEYGDGFSVDVCQKWGKGIF